MIKQYDEVRKVLTGHDFLDYVYFKDNYRLIAIDLSKQKALDADLSAIQQIVFQGFVGGNDNTKIRLNTILTQPKKAALEVTKEQQNFCN